MLSLAGVLAHSGQSAAVIEAEDISAAAVFTASGTTAAVLAQQRLAVPILGMSPSPRVVRQMQLLFGVRMATGVLIWAGGAALALLVWEKIKV